MTSYASRMDDKKYGAATAGGRTERWEKSLVNLVEKPLGWKLEEFGYSHNLWLDVLRVGGFISFFLLIAFTIRSLLQSKRAISVDSKNTALNNLIVIYTLAFYLQFFVEPIFEGSFHLMVIFCFFQGVVNGYRQKYSQEGSFKTAMPQ